MGVKVSDIPDPALRVLAGFFGVLALLFAFAAQPGPSAVTVVELAEPTQQLPSDGNFGTTVLLGDVAQTPELAREPQSAVSGHASLSNPICLPGDEYCYETTAEDMLNRRPVAAPPVLAQDTLVYRSDFSGSVADQFRPITGDWGVVDGAFRQVDDCGYDLIAVLESEPVSHFRVESSFRSISDANNGGIVIHQSDVNTRSGAAVVDLAEDGRVIRWGYYDNDGYYVYEGSQPVTPVKAGELVTLTLEVRDTTTAISFNGRTVATIETPYGSGMVGLVTSKSAVGFDSVELTALAGSPGASVLALTNQQLDWD
jgi:hypothetical protein